MWSGGGHTYRKGVNKYSAGKRADIRGGTFFRSKTEANFARILELWKKQGVIKEWDYEQEEYEFPVSRGIRSYKIDFRVWENHGGISRYEIKGYMDRVSKTKLNRMKKYFPDIKIIVVNSKLFESYAKNSKGMIPECEY